jgi:hypothetical protein
MPADFRFNLGDSVETRPDSRPGVRGYHGETFVGTVLALDYKLRLVTIKSGFDGHKHPAVHESRVYPVPKCCFAFVPLQLSTLWTSSCSLESCKQYWEVRTKLIFVIFIIGMFTVNYVLNQYLAACDSALQLRYFIVREISSHLGYCRATSTV